MKTPRKFLPVEVADIECFKLLSLVRHMSLNSHNVRVNLLTRSIRSKIVIVLYQHQYLETIVKSY